MIPEITDGQLTSVIGPVASGKTWLLERWAERLPRFAVFDPTGEYQNVPEAQHFWAQPKAFADYVADNRLKFRAIYHPGENLEEGFQWVVSTLWQLTEPRFLFIEEMHHVMSPWDVHDSMKLIMKYARKRLLGVVGATQRLSNMHKEFISASRLVVVFNPGNDAAGFQAAREFWGKDTEEMLRGVRPLDYDDKTGVVKAKPQALIIEGRNNPPRVEEIG
jgi:hypothetical protein